MKYRYREGEIDIEPEGDGYRAAIGERLYRVIMRRAEGGALSFEIDGHQHRAFVAIDGGRIHVALNGTSYLFEHEAKQRHHHIRQPGLLTAAMPGQVVAIYVTTGDDVAPGQSLLLLTAMKMEMTISAPEAGVVRAINVQVGDTVARDQELIQLDKR